MSKQAKKKTASKGSTKQKALVVFYNVDPESERGSRLCQIVLEQGLRYFIANKNHLNCATGALASLPGFRLQEKPFDGEEPTEEFMLLCQLTSQQLDSLLVAQREAGLSISLKAQVTQYNKLWPFCTLMQEIAKEHVVMTGTTPDTIQNSTPDSTLDSTPSN